MMEIPDSTDSVFIDSLKTIIMFSSLKISIELLFGNMDTIKGGVVSFLKRNHFSFVFPAVSEAMIVILYSPSSHPVVSKS